MPKGTDVPPNFCPGYVDVHGQWNTGFYCPKPDGPGVHCCGSEDLRYCCSRSSTYGLSHRSHGHDVPLITGAVLAGMIVTGMLVTAVCYFYHTWSHRQRQGSTTETCQEDTCYYPVDTLPEPSDPGNFSDEKQLLETTAITMMMDASENSAQLSCPSVHTSDDEHSTTHAFEECAFAEIRDMDVDQDDDIPLTESVEFTHADV